MKKLIYLLLFVLFLVGCSQKELTRDDELLFELQDINDEELAALKERVTIFTEEELKQNYHRLPPGLRLFIDEKEWHSKLIEILNNTSGLQSFRKRFFEWFNMFRIIKYLNYVHVAFFNKINVTDAASALLKNKGSVLSVALPDAKAEAATSRPYKVDAKGVH